MTATSANPEVAARDLAILARIVLRWRERKAPPSLKELVEEFGLRNPAHAAQHLARLDAAGFVCLIPGARGIQITDAGMAAVQDAEVTK